MIDQLYQIKPNLLRTYCMMLTTYKTGIAGQRYGSAPSPLVTDDMIDPLLAISTLYCVDASHATCRSPPTPKKRKNDERNRFTFLCYGLLWIAR